MTPTPRPQWADVTVLEDLNAEAVSLGRLADSIEEEARSPRHPDPGVRRHLYWAADVVRGWRDEALTTATTGDGLDRRTGLDKALWRRQITNAFLSTWRGPLGEWSA